jgi:hypothetical protein
VTRLDVLLFMLLYVVLLISHLLASSEPSGAFSSLSGLVNAFMWLVQCLCLFDCSSSLSAFLIGFTYLVFLHFNVNF